MARGRKVIAKKSAVVAVRGLAAKGRSATIKRATKETNIEVAVNLDGKGVSNISTGIGFFDHMLDLLARHSRIDITVKAKGDLHIDHHHTTEDVGIALGQAFLKALGEKRGIGRYADIVGRERVIAGVDCGFGTAVRTDPIVADSIVWAKLKSLSEGATIASSRLWGSKAA